MTVGRYVVERQAGAGGMGVVFRARQRGAHGFERAVAVKTIHPSLVADDSHRRRLIEEARIASATPATPIANATVETVAHFFASSTSPWADGGQRSFTHPASSARD